MLAEHAPNVMDYGLWGLLTVIVIRELFKLVHSALQFRHNARGNSSNPHGMNPSELRGHVTEIKDTLKEVRDALVQANTKLDSLVARR